MKVIMDLVKQIDEELEGAKEYAESYIEWKSRGENDTYKRYKEMANDELKHSNYIHDIALSEIDRLENVFMPTEEMREIWKSSHAKYVEKTAWIRTMLNM